MLANGAKLSYSQDGTTYTQLEGLKEIPEQGVDLEKVDNTALEDSNRHYELGIGDLGDTTYGFRWDNTKATSPYRVARELAASGKSIHWKEELKDGSVTKFTGACSVKRTGGSVNGVIDFQINIAIDSEYTFEDPTTP